MAAILPARIERRTAIKWMMTAAAGALLARNGLEAAGTAVAIPPAHGYGVDPDMTRIYHPGELWPLTLTPELRATAAKLCDLIIPADSGSPSASAVGVPDFIDEWISSPYPAQAGDRAIILEGLAWLDAESQRRFTQDFVDLIVSQQHAILDDICDPAAAPRERQAAVRFFKRYRDLTAGGYYTTAEGMKALGYVGNVPLSAFAGPTDEALRQLGLSP